MADLPAATVPVRATPAGHPVLLPRPGSGLARHLARGPAIVTVIIPADAPFAALRLTGMTRPPAGRPGPGRDRGHRELAAYPVTLQSLEFTGAESAQVAP